MLTILYSSVSNVVLVCNVVASLQSVPYCLPSPSFVLFHCWMRNLIASVSERMIQLAVSLTSIASALEQLPLTLVTKGGPPGLAVETVDIQKVQVKILVQHAR